MVLVVPARMSERHDLDPSPVFATEAAAVMGLKKPSVDPAAISY